MRAVKDITLRVLLPMGLVLGFITLSAPAASALPVVYMDRAVVQSMVEPVYGQTGLPGNAGVKEIQRALRARGYGTTVDGWFGTGTRADYAAWQRHLGYEGLGANGIPGPTSLTKLGNNRFEVQRKIRVGSVVSYQGHTVNERTRAMLREADSKVSWGFSITQGSYRGCGGNSACTHAGGGAIDMSVNWSGDSAWHLTDRERYRAWRTVRALRKVGFAAWLRVPSQCSCNWAYHIHAVAVGDTDAHRQAADQVADYYKGRNGLANNGPDNTPDRFKASFTWWEAYRRGSM